MTADPEHMFKVAVFGSSSTRPEDQIYRDTCRLGGLLAAAGCVVVNGGYGGLMEAVSMGAAQAGGHVIGITAPAVFPERSGTNPWIGEERAHASLTERIHDIITLTDATITVPGSIGTLTELLAAWNTAFVARFSGQHPKPVITVGHPWLTLVPHLTLSLATDGSLVTTTHDVDQAVATVLERLGASPAG